MNRFTAFVYLLFFGGYFLVAGILALFVDKFLGQLMISLLFAAVLGVAMIAAALFLLWQFLKGAWYVFDRVWPS